jgi:hypothetical protein
MPALRPLVSLCLLALASPALAAVVPPGFITGVVKHHDGATAAFATVTITDHNSQHLVATATTNSAGVYWLVIKDFKTENEVRTYWMQAVLGSSRSDPVLVTTMPNYTTTMTVVLPD